MGTIIDEKPPISSWEGKIYKVLWGTGKKRGKVAEHLGRNLVNILAYLDAIKKEIKRIEDLEKEANTLGM